VFNIPEKPIKEFIKGVYRKRNDAELPDGDLTLIWMFTNGLVPLGGVVGALLSGFVADKFGR
jgi:hypothetical protein